jgi:hypothetical protein
MPIVLPIIYKEDPKGLNDAKNSVAGFDKVIAGFGIAAAAAFAAASAAAIAFGADSIKAAINSETIARGMENAAKNAGAFGSTAADISKATKALDEHSTKLGELTGIDDELFNKLKTGWLAVPSLAALGTKGINNLAKVTADVAAGTGKDLESIAMAFTKVAGDQTTALGKLTKQGIVLSDQQKETYQSLLDTNGEAEAQAYLIEQLGIKYQGAAEAAADPMARLKVSIDNVQEAIGKAFLPAIEEAVPQLQDFMGQMVASPEFKQFLDDLGTSFENILEWLPSALSNLQSFGKDAMPAVNAFFPMINDSLAFLGEVLLGIQNSDPASSTRDFASSMRDVADGFDRITTAVKWLSDGWNNLPEPVKWIIGQLSQSLNPFSKLTPLFGMIPTSTGAGVSGGRGVKLAAGGVVLPRPGGTLATIGEAGSAEAVIPLDRLEKMVGRGGGNGTTVVVNGNVGWNPEELARQVARKQRQAYALAGITGMVGVA